MAEANALEMKRREAGDRHAARRDRALQRQIALIDSQLADTIAVSPIDGVVLVKSAEVGEVLAPGTTVVTIGDIDHPWLRAYIERNRSGPREAGRAAQAHHGFVSRQNLQRARIVHLVAKPSSRPSRSRPRKSA